MKHLRTALLAVLLCLGGLVAQPVTFRGFDASPLGSAVVQPAVGPGGNYLRVQNLGSGSDGVSLLARQVDGLSIELDQAKTGIPMPVGTRIVSRPRGALAGNPNVPIGPMILDKTAATWDLTFDRSSIGVTHFTIELFLGDVLVDVLDNQSTSVTLSWSSAVEARVLNHSGLLLCLLLWVGDANFQDEVELDAATMISLDGLQIAYADRIRVKSHGASIPQTLSRVNVRATGTPALGISGLRFYDLGARTRALGATRIESSAMPGAGLQLSNIGSSGQDGITLEVFPSRNFGLDLGTISPPPNGASTLFTTSGTAAGTKFIVGTFGASLGQEGAEISTDLSPLQPTACRLEVYLNGQLVLPPMAQPPGPWYVTVPTPVSYSHQIGIGCGVTPAHLASLDVAVTHTLEAPVPVSVSLPGGPALVVADAIRVVAVGTRGAVDWISDVEMIAQDMGDIEMTSYFAALNDVLLHPAAAGTAGGSTLQVGGSDGGYARRVDVGIGEPFPLHLDVSAGGPGPFALFGMIRAANDWDVVDVPGVGEMSITPSILDPTNPELFLLADSFGIPGAFISVPSATTPFDLPFPHPGTSYGGINFTLQAVQMDPLVPGGLTVSNALIVRLL